MRYSIFFMIALILVSGFIAYFGDLLGRKMGKKRLTLFRLRPRYTAIVVTTITGMVISFLALVLFTSINSQFRQVLTRGEQIFNQNKHLAFANSSLERRNKALINRSKTLEREVAQRQEEVKKARKLAFDAQKAKAMAVLTISKLEKEISGRQKELAALKSRSETAESLVRQRTEELHKLQANMEVAQRSLKLAQANLSGAEGKLATAKMRLSTTLNQLADAEKKLAELKETTAMQREFLQDSQAQLVKVGKEKLEFERQTSDLRNRDLIARQGDEIARAVVSPRQSEFGIRGDLFSLLEIASNKAASLGAKTGSNNRAVNVIFRQVVNSDYGLYTENERFCINKAIEAIGNGFNDVLVQVVCAKNTLADEQIQVELKLYLNNRVYRQGARIAGCKMDGHESEGRILLSVISFLQQQVSRSALRAGIIPISNPDPREALGKNPQEQVDALMSVVDRIKAQNKEVIVETFASDDVYAAGPLNMDNMRFTIVPAE